MKVLKFGAIWCKECLVMKPIWAEIEKDVSGFLSEYYDADLNSEKIEEYKVDTLPTFIFLDKSANEILRLKGAQNKDDLVKLVKDNLDK